MRLNAEQVEVLAQTPRQATLEEVADLCEDWQQLAIYVEQLEERLECWAMTDGGERIRVGSDGIACRDETIRLLDQRIEVLESRRLTTGELKPAQVHAMCAYLESSKDCACIQCPPVVKTDYGYGTGACYMIAEETLKNAREILQPPEDSAMT